MKTLLKVIVGLLAIIILVAAIQSLKIQPFETWLDDAGSFLGLGGRDVTIPAPTTPVVTPAPILTPKPPEPTPAPIIPPVTTTPPAPPKPEPAPLPPESTSREVTVDGKTLSRTTGEPVVLTNYTKAKDPTWVELRAFLLADDTDTIHTVPGQWGYIDFAERLHNRAEAAGIRCAFVVVQLGPSWLYPSGGDHYINAFQTADQDIVYVDEVSFNLPTNQDKTVSLNLNSFYVPKGILGNPVGPQGLGHMGQILRIRAIEW